ncbi:hypothetical protein AB2B41_23880, partial [Marimonas sp. MJW-29]
GEIINEDAEADRLEAGGLSPIDGKSMTGSSLTGRGLRMTPKMAAALLEARDEAGRSATDPTHACSGPIEPG